MYVCIYVYIYLVFVHVFIYACQEYAYEVQHNGTSPFIAQIVISSQTLSIQGGEGTRHRSIACLIFTGHFSQKSSMLSGSFAENDPQFTFSTGWQRPTGCLKLQVILRRRAINDRALLRKMTFKDKASYGSSPPFTSKALTNHKFVCFTWAPPYFNRRFLINGRIPLSRNERTHPIIALCVFHVSPLSF